MPLPTIPSGNVNSGLATGYDVANSVRLDGSSAYMNKTMGTPTDADKYTFSFWCKRSKLGAQQSIFRSTNGNNDSHVTFQADDTLRFEEYGGLATIGKLQTTQVFRDVSSWYSIILVYDSGNATAGNRMRMYVNGTEVTSFGTDTNPSQDADSFFNKSGEPLHFGRTDYSGGGNYFSGYVAELVMVDGQALTPSSFGEFSEDSPNIWMPKDVSGLTFGNNGFYLDFEDSGDLDDDESGNTNDFTATNLAATDQTTDTPTNNFATLNPLNPTVHDFEEGNLKFNGTTTNWDSAFSTIGASSGKWYFEMKFLALEGGLRRAAMGLVDARDQTLMATNEVGYNITGTVGDSVGYNGNGTSNTIKKNDTGQYNGTEWSVNDIICMAVDLDNSAVYFRVNGSAWLNSGNPESGASKTGAVTITAGETYVFGGTAYGGSTEWEFNFGSPSFAISSGNADANGYGNMEFAIPSGYFCLNTKNLAEYG